MKRIANILSVFLITVMVILLSVWPHHHHGSQMCVVIECCESDGSINDEHTSHSSSSDDESHHEGCQLQLLGESPSAKGVDFSLEKVDLKKMILPLFSIFTEEAEGGLHFILTHVCQNEFVFNDRSISLLFYRGLRAPPIA